MLSHAAQHMSQQDPNLKTVTARCTSINSRDGSDPRRPKKGSPAWERKEGRQPGPDQYLPEVRGTRCHRMCKLIKL